MSDDRINELVEALNDHQVTDDQGNVSGEQTSGGSTTAQKQTPVEDDAMAEKPAETEETSPEVDEESENEPEMVETASDETGKRYVPESRFKEVYAKWKKAERKAKESGKTPPPMPVQMPQPQQPINKMDALESEILRSTLPQFNPESDQYSRELDELGFSIYESSKNAKGEHTMTMIQAGKKALAMAKKLTTKLVDAKSEARTVKAQQSDHGVTSRVLNREPQKKDPMKLSLEEKEKWLKENNLW